jgi:hypothetical protein
MHCSKARLHAFYDRIKHEPDTYKRPTCLRTTTLPSGAAISAALFADRPGAQTALALKE